MSDRIYCGNGKEKTFNNGGAIIELTISADDIFNNLAQYGFETKAGKRMIRLKVGKRREIDQYGNSHSVEIDTWKPDPNKSFEQKMADNGQKQKQSNNDSFQDDIPFN